MFLRCERPARLSTPYFVVFFVLQLGSSLTTLKIRLLIQKLLRFPKERPNATFSPLSIYV